ncbi:hypothetical protein MBANPS3_000441 [Mucor bainieri]
MSSFQRRFASLLSTDSSSPSATTATSTSTTPTKTQSSTSAASSATANSLTPDMALFNSPNMGSNIRLSPADRQHHQRPVSEILKPESFISPETQVLDKWFEDLQQYESSLESMATASLDPKYKEEVQHVDQWFRYLNEAERTATIYTLLQHSTQVQIRFFITVLQQMDRKDPVGALLSPAHPEKASNDDDTVDMQAQLTGAMKKAELEASQKLLSVLPYQTGQVIARPNANAIRRQHIDRHSFALGDTEEYDHLFSRIPGDYSMRNSYASQQQQQQQHQRGMFDHPINTRPKSVIEGNSSIFSNDWSYGGFGQHHQQQQQQRPNATVGANRPKSADISNWSFGLTSSVSSKSGRDSSKDPLASPWSGLSPTVSTFGEQQQQQQQQLQQQNEMDQQLSMMANKWNLGGGGGNGSSNNRSSVILSDDTNGFKRRAAAMSIPETAGEQYHVQLPPTTPAPGVNNPTATTTNIVLSLYDESASTPSTSTQLFGHNEKRDSFYKAGESSPVPSQSASMNLFSMSTNTRPLAATHSAPKQQHHTFGQFLNPNDRVNTSESIEAGYYSDHSDASNRSNGSKSYFNNNNNKNKKKVHYAGNNVAQNGGYHNNASRNVAVGGGNHTPGGTTKDNKKNVDVVDMNLLEDVPAWLRSLRLHKYNSIFETMKWQDMLKMDDEALLSKGVAALGARRKLLKVFDQVKAHCAAQNITY